MTATDLFPSDMAFACAVLNLAGAEFECDDHATFRTEGSSVVERGYVVAFPNGGYIAFTGSGDLKIGLPGDSDPVPAGETCAEKLARALRVIDSLTERYELQLRVLREALSEARSEPTT